MIIRDVRVDLFLLVVMRELSRCQGVKVSMCLQILCPLLSCSVGILSMRKTRKTHLLLAFFIFFVDGFVQFRCLFVACVSLSKFGRWSICSRQHGIPFVIRRAWQRGPSMLVFIGSCVCTLELRLDVQTNNKCETFVFERRATTRRRKEKKRSEVNLRSLYFVFCSCVLVAN